jgi:hypothetical protein
MSKQRLVEREEMARLSKRLCAIGVCPFLTLGKRAVEERERRYQSLLSHRKRLCAIGVCPFLTLG